MTAVSVIVPCFNTERYLGAALASVLGQSRQAAEVVVVDDGSTDASAAVAAGYAPAVRCIAQANAGISAARNRGVAGTSGAILAFLDADDLWPADSLARRLAVLEADARLDGVFGAVEQFVSPEIPASERAQYDVPPGAQPARLAGALLVRRRVFNAVGPFDTAVRLGETIDWIARVQDAGYRLAQVDAVVLRRRIHGANSVLRERHRQSDYLRVLRASIERRRQAASGEATE